MEGITVPPAEMNSTSTSQMTNTDSVLGQSITGQNVLGESNVAGQNVLGQSSIAEQNVLGQNSVSGQSVLEHGVSGQSVSRQTKPSLSIVDLPLTQEKVKSTYADVFQGLGKFPGEPYKLRLKPDAVPAKHRPRRVPVHLQDAFHEEIE